MANFWENDPIVQKGNFWENDAIIGDNVAPDLTQSMQPAGDPRRGSQMNSAINMLTMGGAEKLGAAEMGLLDAVGGALSGGGFNYSDNYNKRLAQMRADQAAYEEQNPWKSGIGKAGGIAGGIAMLPAALPFRGAGMAARTGNVAATGAAYGGAGGAIQDANDTPERIANIAKGAGWGTALGLGSQAAIKGVSTVLRPLTSRWNPGGAADRVMANTMDSASATPQTLAVDLARAQRDGQGVFAVADALGHPGQRLTSTIARTPNEGRTGLVDFLEQRQGGQGRRIANALAEGFDAPDTALQRTAGLTKARNKAADAGYAAARNNAKDVDVMPAVTAIDNLLGGGNVKGAMGIAPDSIEAALLGVRSKLINQDGSAQVVGFDEILRVKMNLDDAIIKAAAEPNKARLLKQVQRSIDNSLESASKPYAAARDQFRAESKAIDAIETGRTAAMRGRTEDTIPAFRGMQPAEQAAFRAGYVDPLIGHTQGAAFGVNKARPLINDATEAEFPAFAAPGRGPQLGSRIAREQTMFETRNAALGGSKTADNLADEAALSAIDPSVIGNVLSGNWTGAIRSGLMQAISELKGQPASVRKELAKRLMETNPAVARRIAQSARNSRVSDDARIAAMARALMVGGTDLKMSYSGRGGQR